MPRFANKMTGLVILSVALMACSSPPRAGTPAPQQIARADHVETGVASWYGQPYHGRRTASGERFDMNAMTAAHPSLPFGTQVRVTNLENGRSVVLRINDRGPHVGGRIIDVSRHSAEHLGFRRMGTARVRVEAAR